MWAVLPTPAPPAAAGATPGFRRSRAPAAGQPEEEPLQKRGAFRVSLTGGSGFCSPLSFAGRPAEVKSRERKTAQKVSPVCTSAGAGDTMRRPSRGVGRPACARPPQTAPGSPRGAGAGPPSEPRRRRETGLSGGCQVWGLHAVESEVRVRGWIHVGLGRVCSRARRGLKIDSVRSEPASRVGI